MKKRNLILISSILVTLFFSGCTKDIKVQLDDPKPSTDINISIPKVPVTEGKPKEESKVEVTPVVQPKPVVYFKKGSTGDEIRSIQKKLNKFGYNLVTDGDFGPATHFAVVDFQKKNKLTANGIVDSATLLCLDKQPTAQTTYKPPAAVPKPTTNDAASLEKYVNSKSFASNTNYFIWIDLPKQKVHIFSGSNENWKLVKSMTCSSGKASTPTVKGFFTVGNKGSYFIADGGARCKYYTQISGNYLFHTVLYDNKGEKIIDGRLGIPLSHGCVRLAPENAKYIYDNIPRGTLIWSN